MKSKKPKSKPLSAEQAVMLERFKTWLQEPGYSPLVAKMRDPIGVTIGPDGLINPTVSADMPYYLLGREIPRAVSEAMRQRHS